MQGKCEYYAGNEERNSSKYIQFPEAVGYEHIEKGPMTLIKKLGGKKTSKQRTEAVINPRRNKMLY